MIELAGSLMGCSRLASLVNTEKGSLQQNAEKSQLRELTLSLLEICDEKPINFVLLLSEL